METATTAVEKAPAIAEKPTTDNPTTEVNMAELERMTNAEHGWVPESKSSEPKPEPVSEVKAPAPVAAGQASIDELREIFKDTPYYQEGRDVKEVAAELKKGYKELEGQNTKTSQRLKPFEQLIDLASKDPKFAQALHLARDVYMNPALQEAYANQAAGLQRPDPTQFDLYDPAQRQTYDQAVTDYEARLIDSRINARFSTIEQERSVNQAKAEFKQLVPDGNADELMKWVNEDFTNLSIGERMRGFWQLKNLPKLREQIYAEVRKDVGAKIETASKSTPVAPAPPSQTVSDEEIVKYVTLYGPKAAATRYNQKTVDAAVNRYTNKAYAE